MTGSVDTDFDAQLLEEQLEDFQAFKNKFSLGLELPDPLSYGSGFEPDSEEEDSEEESDEKIKFDWAKILSRKSDIIAKRQARLLADVSSVLKML